MMVIVSYFMTLLNLLIFLRAEIYTIINTWKIEKLTYSNAL